MATARIRTQRHPAQLVDASSRAGAPSPGAAVDQSVGRLASHGIRPAPFVWGSPGWVAGSRATPPLESTADRRRMEELPQGGRGALRTGRQLLGQRLPPAVRSERHASADPVLADLERAQLWRSSSRPTHRPASTPSCCGSPTPRSPARTRRLGSCSPGWSPTRIGRPGTSSTTSTRREREGQLRRRGPAPVRLRPQQVQNAFQQFRRVMKEHSDGQTPLWVTEIGWGSNPPDQFGINKGLAGQERLLRSPSS